MVRWPGRPQRWGVARHLVRVRRSGLLTEDGEGDAWLHRPFAHAGLGARRLAKLKPADLDAFYRQLLTSGGVGGRPLSPGTVRRIHGILRRALNQGVKWGWLGVNPATATTPPRVPVSDIKPPSAEALGRVLRRAESQSPDLHCYLMVAAATGARRSELIALRWTDVDSASATVSIERGIVEGPDGLVEKRTKTHSARRVSLDVRTAAVVEEHRVRMADRAAACRVPMAADAFVFSNAADASTGARPMPLIRAVRRLDADHLGTHVTQILHGRRPLQEMAKAHDLHAVEQHGCLPDPGARWRALVWRGRG